MTVNRNDIPEKYTWDLTEIYKTEKDFDSDFEKAKKLIDDFSKHKDIMLNSSDNLCDMIEDLTDIDRKVSKLYQYASRTFDLDTSNNKGQTLIGRVTNLYNDFCACSYFVKPSILKMDEKTLSKWYDENKRLSQYKYPICKIFKYKSHTLSDECEKLMADLQKGMDTASQVRSIFANSDLKFGRIKDGNNTPVELNESNYSSFMTDEDRTLRKRAFKKLYSVYKEFGNTFAQLLDGFAREKVAYAKATHYDSDLDASVIYDEVDSGIYKNLISTVRENLPSLYKYYDLKKEMIGVKSLHLYDISAPVLKGFDKKYDYDRAVSIVLDVVKIFGDEYYNTLKKGLTEDRWVDVYYTKGKRGGAYSSGCYDTKPYILLNYEGKTNDVSTLIHEAGHSMHSYFSRKNNKPIESEYTIFVAEVASTVNELLLADKMIKESSDDYEKLDIISRLLDTYKGTLFRQTMFAEFELFFHEKSQAGVPLTSELLSNQYYDTVKAYFGPGVYCDDEIRYEWMRIPHFYYNFYVYKYATCISAASSVVKKIRERGDEYVNKYIDFLKCGGSMSPLDSLKVAEIDLSKPEVIRDACKVFEDYTNQFETIKNRINK